MCEWCPRYSALQKIIGAVTKVDRGGVASKVGQGHVVGRTQVGCFDSFVRGGGVLRSLCRGSSFSSFPSIVYARLWSTHFGRSCLSQESCPLLRARHIYVRSLCIARWPADFPRHQPKSKLASELTNRGGGPAGQSFKRKPEECTCGSGQSEGGGEGAQGTRRPRVCMNQCTPYCRYLMLLGKDEKGGSYKQPQVQQHRHA